MNLTKKQLRKIRAIINREVANSKREFATLLARSDSGKLTKAASVRLNRIAQRVNSARSAQTLLNLMIEGKL